MTGVQTCALPISISITVEAGCGIAILGRPEVEMTSETSGLGGYHVVEDSPLVFTQHFSDFESSLNVALIPNLLALRKQQSVVYQFQEDRK